MTTTTMPDTLPTQSAIEISNHLSTLHQSAVYGSDMLVFPNHTKAVYDTARILGTDVQEGQLDLRIAVDMLVYPENWV